MLQGGSGCTPPAFVPSPPSLQYIGTNAIELGYGSQSAPLFLNALKNAGGNKAAWDTINNSGTETDEEPYLQIDSNGYPTSLVAGNGFSGTQQFTRVRTYCMYNIYATDPLPPGAANVSPTGSYTFMFQGAGTLVFIGCTALSSSSPDITIGTDSLTGSPSVTSTQPANTVATVTMTLGASGLQLEIAAITSGNYLKAMEFVDSSYLTEYFAGTQLHPLYKALLTDNGAGCFSRIRAMGALNTYTQQILVQFEAAVSEGDESASIALVSWGANGATSTTWPFASGTFCGVLGTGQQVEFTVSYDEAAISWNAAASAGISLLSAPTPSTAPYTMASIAMADWSHRPLLSNFSWCQSGGIPYEAILQIGNEVGIAVWLAIPGGNVVADPSYVTNLAQLAYNGTGANVSGSRLSAFSGLTGARLWIEVGDELAWNYGAGYEFETILFGMLSYASGIMTLAGDNFEYGCAEWAAAFTALLSATFASTYGSSFASRCTVVYMGQNASGQWDQYGVFPAALNGANAISAGVLTKPAFGYNIGAIGWQAYFGLGSDAMTITEADAATILALADPTGEIFSLAYTNTGTSGNTYSSFPAAGWVGNVIVQAQANYNAYAGQSFASGWDTLPIVCYEAGPSMNNNVLYNALGGSNATVIAWAQLLLAVSRDARFAYCSYDPTHQLSSNPGVYPALAAIGPTGGKITVNKLGLVQCPAYTRDSASNSYWGGYGAVELAQQMVGIESGTVIPSYQCLVDYAQGVT
jgi:hypothetical protein